MNNINHGDSAFPSPHYDQEHGMSLRDYFAAKAIAAIAHTHEAHDTLAMEAYAIADAMLVERAK